MTFNELHKEYEKMCDSQACYACKYNGNFPCGLQFGYEQGRADAIEEFANYLIKNTKFLPKEPNGHSKVYDEAGIIHFIEVGLEQLKEQNNDK